MGSRRSAVSQNQGPWVRSAPSFGGPSMEHRSELDLVTKALSAAFFSRCWCKAKNTETISLIMVTTGCAQLISISNGTCIIGLRAVGTHSQWCAVRDRRKLSQSTPHLSATVILENSVGLFKKRLGCFTPPVIVVSVVIFARKVTDNGLSDTVLVIVVSKNLPKLSTCNIRMHFSAWDVCLPAQCSYRDQEIGSFLETQDNYIDSSSSLFHSITK